MSASFDQHRQQVQAAVQKTAQNVGNKASNLILLDNICAKIKKQLNINVRVPEILPLSHTIILDHLNKNASEWKRLWALFKEKQNNEQGGLKAEAVHVLEALQKLILKTFDEHPMPPATLKEYLTFIQENDPSNPNIGLMVRSTGKEDSVDLANPGGNESVPAGLDPLEISHAIGIVVASYFSEKSLKQRLLGKDGGQAILEDPFMPVLLQRMIGEPLLGQTTTKPVIKSGVMYTSPVGARIQLAPGHGELIVNSKGLFDTFFVTRENVVHAEINQKSERLVPALIQEDRKTRRVLISQSNPKALRDQPSISNFAALKLAEVGRMIEEHYGMQMDIEFVYEPHPTNPEQDVIYLVQARPIPKGDLKLVIPSSIPPDKIPDIKSRSEISKGSVVTPGGSAAKVITDRSQIIICDTIETALKIYLAQKDSPVKAVIIKNMAPFTSHEAAQFNSKAIPVLQVDNLGMIESWVNGERPVLIVDPQRSQLVNYSKHIKRHQESEQELYASGVLKQGFFKSPMPAQETLIPVFNLVSEKAKALVQTDAKDRATVDIKEASDNLHKFKIGDLITKAKSSDPKESADALQLLLPGLFSLLDQTSVRSSREPNVKKESSKEGYQSLLNKIEIIEAAKVGETNTEAFKALQNILMFFYKLGQSSAAKQAGSAHRKLFQQAMITGAEIYKSLQEFSKLTLAGNDADGSDIKERQKELLELISKLEGLIKNPGNKSLFSSSVRQIAQENKARDKAKPHEAEFKLSAEQEAYFTEFMKLQKVALNKKFATQWSNFTLICCQEPNKTQQLAHLIKYATELGFESDWINQSFARHCQAVLNEKNKEKLTKLLSTASVDKNKIEALEANRILSRMTEEALQVAKELNGIKLGKHRSLIKSWEHRIGEWADPLKFDKLWKEYEKDLLPLIDTLTLEPQHQPLTINAILKTVQDLTEMMDRTIKAMKGSSEYKESDRTLQAERFAKLLTPYHKLMEKWAKQIPEEQFAQWAKAIDDRVHFNQKENILSEINKIFNNLIKNPTADQLNSSGYFSVASARIGSPASFARQFVDREEKLTLEDLFTLMHQNILSSTIFLGQKTKTAKEDLPEPIQPFIAAFEGIQVNTEDGRTTKTELVSIDHKYPLVQLEYNLPLQNHSAKFIIEYNQETQKTIIHTKLFGENHGGRMNSICQLAELDRSCLGLQTTQKAKYDASSLSLEFKWEFDKEQINGSSDTVKQALSHYARMTFLGAVAPTWEEEEALLFSRHLNSNRKAEVFSNLSKDKLRLAYQFFAKTNVKMFLQMIEKYPEDKNVIKDLIEERLTVTSLLKLMKESELERIAPAMLIELLQEMSPKDYLEIFSDKSAYAKFIDLIKDPQVSVPAPDKALSTFAKNDFQNFLIVVNKNVRNFYCIDDLISISEFKKEHWAALIEHPQFSFYPSNTKVGSREHQFEIKTITKLMQKLIEMKDFFLIQKAIEKGYDIHALNFPSRHSKVKLNLMDYLTEKGNLDLVAQLKQLPQYISSERGVEHKSTTPRLPITPGFDLVKHPKTDVKTTKAPISTTKRPGGIT